MFVKTIKIVVYSIFLSERHEIFLIDPIDFYLFESKKFHFCPLFIADFTKKCLRFSIKKITFDMQTKHINFIAAHKFF